jgi:hypothetical protein
MELSIDTAERIALGLLSFIALIAWCRWRGTPEHQQKDQPAQLPKRGERKKRNGQDQSLISAIDGALEP